MRRRSFIKAVVTQPLVVGLIQGAMGLAVAVPGLRMLLAPLQRRRREGGFIRVSTLSALPHGRPFRAVISTDRWDAYTHYPPGPIGTVWLIRDGDTTAPRIRGYQTICPHLGCGIESGGDDTTFICRCHSSGFDANGRRVFGPSPRDMDELTCRVTDPDDRGRRWVEVKYQEFRTGVPAKEPLA